MHPDPRRASPVVRAAAALLPAIALATGCGAALAQAYPSRAITILSGNAAGGAPDILVRTLAEELRQALRQQVVVHNRTGANGSIAMDVVRRARPDGYTLMFATMTTAVVNPHTQKDARYHAAEDFEPIARHVLQPALWVANRSTGFRSLKDVVDYARKHADLRVSRQGYGASSHLVAAELMVRNNLAFTLVGYTGSSEAYLAMRRGDVHVGVDLPQSVIPRVRAGDAVALAVTSSSRIRALPDVPTWIEQGVMDSELTAWYAYLAPRGTPREIVDLLNVEINRILVAPKFREKLEEAGGIVRTATPSELREYIRDEHERWRGIVRAADIKPD